MSTYGHFFVTTLPIILSHFLGMILKNNETLLQHGIKPQDVVQVEMFSALPDLYPIKRIHNFSDASQVITVRVQTGPLVDVF